MLLQEVEVLQLVTVEVTVHIDSFRCDDYHFVAGVDDLGHNEGVAAQHVATTIDVIGLRRKAWHSGNIDKLVSRNYHTGTGTNL